MHEAQRAYLSRAAAERTEPQPQSQAPAARIRVAHASIGPPPGRETIASTPERFFSRINATRPLTCAAAN
jgi:hypothetical protein